MSEAPLRLVVLGDSTAFTGEKGPLLPDDKTLYPNVLAAALERDLRRPVALTVIAQAGADIRDAYRSVMKDRHVMFEVMPFADAVVVGVGSIDNAPGGVPPVLEAIVPYIRNAALRRRARLALRWANPRVVRLTRGRRAHTQPDEFERLYSQVLFQVRALTQGRAAGVAMGPTSHRSRYYGGTHPRHAELERRQLAVARRHGFATVASWPLVEPHAGRLNVDGIHWPPEAHAAVGEALAAPLVAQLRGEAPRPSAPAWGEAPPS